MTPKDFTAQEEQMAVCLDELGLRYSQQVQIGKYVVDFLVENNIILEADGVFGHYKKSDKKRDAELLELDPNIVQIIHIKDQEKEMIKKRIMDVLLCQE